MEFLNSLFDPIRCIGWLIVGALAGGAARSLMKGSDAPFIQDVILGLIGSFVGGVVASFIGFGPQGATGIERVVINLIIAVIGAVIVLFIGKNVLRRG
jgi:uncharacterized membrane protein YeaQ/YmgE (transglycosylase-associated protein family)